MCDADRRWFILEDEAYEIFSAHLERPPVVKPRLAALLAEQDEESE